MDLKSAKDVMRRLNVVKDKINALPDALKEEVQLECKLIEDRIRDKFYRSKKRNPSVIRGGA